MLIIEIIFILLVSFMAFGLSMTNIWHWNERDTLSIPHYSEMSNRKWHMWQYWGVLVPVFIIFTILSKYNISIYAILLSIPIWWITFDGVIGLKLFDFWWGVGDSSFIDKLIKTPMIKISMLSTTLTLYILNKINILNAFW